MGRPAHDPPAERPAALRRTRPAGSPRAPRSWQRPCGRERACAGRTPSSHERAARRRLRTAAAGRRAGGRGGSYRRSPALLVDAAAGCWLGRDIARGTAFGVRGAGYAEGMERHPHVLHSDRTSPPGVREALRRRRHHVAFAAVGAGAGLVVGLLAVFFLSQPRDTGAFSGGWRETAVVVFGLPALLAISCGVIGWLLSAAPEVEDVDAPVRDTGGLQAGTAAVSEEGQLPGSPVEPNVSPPGQGSD